MGLYNQSGCVESACLGFSLLPFNINFDSQTAWIELYLLDTVRASCSRAISLSTPLLHVDHIITNLLEQSQIRRTEGRASQSYLRMFVCSHGAA